MTTPRSTLAAEIRALRDARGHAVDNARVAAGRLKAAVADGSVALSPALERMLADLRAVITEDEGQRLGGKSSEAARFILDAIIRELDRG